MSGFHTVWVRVAGSGVVHLPHPLEPIASGIPYCGAGRAGNREIVTATGGRPVCQSCLRKEELYG